MSRSPGGALYGLKQDKSKKGNVVKTEVWLSVPTRLLFRLQDETALEQWTSYKDGKPHGMFAWYSANGSKENPSHLAVYKDGEVMDGHRDSLVPLYQELMLPQFASF